MAIISKFFASLSRNNHFLLISIFVLILIASFFEMFTLAMLFPYLSILIDVRPEDSNIDLLYFYLEKASLFFGTSIVNFVTITLILFILLSLITRVILNILLSKTIFDIGFKLSSTIFSSFLYRPYLSHIEKSSDEISASIIKIDNFLQVFNAALQGLSTLIIGIFILLSIFYLDFSVALYLSAYFIILYLIIMGITQKRLRANGELLNSSLNKRTKSILESSRGVKEIILNACQEFFLSRFNYDERNYRNAQISNHIIAPLPRLLIESIAIISIVGISFYFYSNSNQSLAVLLPSFTVAIVAFQRVLPMFQQSYHGWVLFRGHQDIIASVTDDFNEALAINKEHSQKIASGKNKIKFNNNIELKNISFSYLQDKKILDDLNLTIKKGEKVGIIGESGVGKTTLINILMGLVFPSKGNILVDGIKIEKEDIYAWWKNISHLPQKVFLFDDYLKENIAIGADKNDIDDTKIFNSLKKVSLENFIEGNNYKNLYLGEDGNQISGGQKQRVALSRAFYKESEILILDEPSSALDEATEIKVLESLFKDPNITVIFISHSHAFLDFCDHVYELRSNNLHKK
tara:strand:- start:8555 stop:10285 length:1731 start_codon:yes stop_codon:yes gene_type:complete